jgi:glycerophosphoryl diester phosphodiesterase
MNKIRWFAHKALGSNKLLDIKNSCTTNAYGIELDVQLYNNKLVLNHDLIRDNFNKKYPLLSDALKIIKDTDKMILLDIKGIDKKENVASELKKELEKIQINKNKILISSFNESYLSEINHILPEQKLGYITCNVPCINFNFVPHFISFISLDYNIINQSIVNMIKNCNKDVFIWTIKNDKKINLKNIDYIISDIKLN